MQRMLCIALGVFVVSAAATAGGIWLVRMGLAEGDVWRSVAGGVLAAIAGLHALVSGAGVWASL